MSATRTGPPRVTVELALDELLLLKDALERERQEAQLAGLSVLDQRYEQLIGRMSAAIGEAEMSKRDSERRKEQTTDTVSGEPCQFCTGVLVAVDADGNELGASAVYCDHWKCNVCGAEYE